MPYNPKKLKEGIEEGKRLIKEHESAIEMLKESIQNTEEFLKSKGDL